ncbi:MAG: hypothetical protein R3C28_26300 [Pirellulaceae bacterium]
MADVMGEMGAFALAEFCEIGGVIIFSEVITGVAEQQLQRGKQDFIVFF